VFVTAVAMLTHLGGAVTTVDCTDPAATEVGVQVGCVSVETPGGAPLADVREGELITVRRDGELRKQVLRSSPDEFAWDLRRPLPPTWCVGYREVTPNGPVVRPDFWFDPYHRAEMSQIRSDKQWTRGFFQLYPESLVRVRYRVARPG